MSITWRVEDRDCPICKSSEVRFLGARGGRAHREGRGVETRMVRCVRCHGVYQKPTLLPETNPYSETDAQEYFRLHESWKKVECGEELAAFAESVLGQPGSMVELGCGRGDLLRGARNRGWKVFGVEMTAAFADIAREGNGVEVECSSISDAKTLDGTYDVVILAAVLEHLYDPLEAFGRVRHALRPGGLVFIDVPNECSLMTYIGNLYLRTQGKDWAVNLSPTFPPFHVVGFCSTSLRWLLNAAGFKVLTLDLYQTRNALPYSKGILARLERRALDVTLFLGRLIAMGAGITCWAVRNEEAM